MAKSKDDTTYATSQARLNEDEAIRVSYKHGTPLEGGKIADSEPVDLLSSAHNIAKATTHHDSTDQSQMNRHDHPNINNEGDQGGSTGPQSMTKSAVFPKKSPPAIDTKYL